jgi:uncharacterized protein (DUF1778 family)
MSPMVNRDKKLTVRASDEELAMLQAVADAAGVSSSDVVRMFIRKAHAARFGGETPAKSKPAKSKAASR